MDQNHPTDDNLSQHLVDPKVQTRSFHNPLAGGGGFGALQPGTHRLLIIENPGLSDHNINPINKNPHITTTSVNQRYLEQRDRNHATKVSRIVKEAMSEHDAGRSSLR